MKENILILGLGITGRAVAESLLSKQLSFSAFDDVPSRSLKNWTDKRGIELLGINENQNWKNLLDPFSEVVVSPGIPDRHPVFKAALDADIKTVDESDLADRWDQRPRCAITGTNGKTTVVTLVVEMLEKSGIKALPAGNLETPLVTAIENKKAECFVVEASSFRLAHAENISASVAAWLNFSPDHLDHHYDLESYLLAKNRVWEGVEESVNAIGNSGDPTVSRFMPPDATSFGSDTSFCAAREGKIFFDEAPIMEIKELPRKMPHDIENAQAAIALAFRFGADLEACVGALKNFQGLSHRVEFILRYRGVDFVNDSKSTTPHSTIAALSGLPNAVLIVGGKNKGLDLALLANTNPKSVVAIGETAEEFKEIFYNKCVVEVGNTMDEAVFLAFKLANGNGTVLFSPGCASFDWYDSYLDRGLDFIRAVSELGNS